jgi:lipopolysaccharide assembly outer membrane protein LptD (OstA)
MKKAGRWILAAGFLSVGGTLRAASTAPATIERADLPSLSTATLTCDYLEFRSSDNAVLARGNAVLLSEGTRLEADALTLFLSSRVAEAEGHVYLEDPDVSVMAESIRYSWGETRGVLENVFLQQGVWRTWGRRLERLGPSLFRIERPAFTSCELDPPHYHFRGSKAVYRSKESVSVTHARPAVETTPVFYLPFYRRALTDNAWTLTIDPGNSARNGTFAKTVFSVPVGDHARASVLWDYYAKAGNGFGGEFSYSSAAVRGSLSGYSIDDKIEDARRWNFRFAHWQQLAPRWQVQSNVAFQSDEDVNNIYVGDDVERVRQLGESDLALTYTAPWFTARGFAEHDRSYDAVKNRFVEAKTILPQFGFGTSALRLGKSSAYFQFSGNFRNEYDRPEQNPPDPEPIYPGKDQYRQYADGTGSLRWRVPVTKTISLEPSAGLTEAWQSHQDLGAELDPQDLTQGNGFTGLNLRHRLTRNLDYDLTHRYKVRWTPNTFHRDHAALDRGLEQNDLTFFGSYRPSQKIWGRASTTYDFRDTEAQNYQSPRQRFSPPWAEVQVQPRAWFSAFARETVQLYPARKPQSTLFNFRFGKDERAFYSSGFSYNVGRPGELDVNSGAAFPLTRNWWLGGDLHYTLAGSGGTHYNRVDFKEKNLIVRRDLHCWVLRVTYKERPGSNELYFRLDLKSNMEVRQKQAVVDEKQFYPARDARDEY